VTTVNDHDADKATFRLGAVYKITDITSAFAQYSQGFKAPDMIDLYYASERNYGPGNHTCVHRTLIWKRKKAIPMNWVCA